MPYVKKFDFNENENFEIPDYCDHFKKKQKKKSIRKIIVTSIQNYCSSTSIHGMQYLSDSRPLWEKFFWALVFLASVYCCVFLIINVYDKWMDTPVIVSFSEKTTPVWHIPFPAITICSETKRIRREGASFGKFFSKLRSDIKNGEHFKAENLTETELEEFRTLLHICNTQIVDEGMPLLSKNPIDYCNVLDRMLPTFERYYYFCKWFGKFSECSEIFTKTYTEEGICYTFNGLTHRQLYRENTYQYKQLGNVKPSKIDNSNGTLSWSLQEGYALNSDVKTYPVRVLGAGARAGLFIALQSFRQEVDYACRGPVQGFKVLIHSPDDAPRVSTQFIRIPNGKEVLIAVKPNMITTSTNIAEYHYSRRQCYLSSERHLKYFKVYTQNNCELECLANFTLNKCGCVKFSMPRTLDTPVCNEDKIPCYDEAEDHLLLREFNQGLKDMTLDYRLPTECNCLPACTSLSYNSEISQGDFDLEQLLLVSGDTDFFKEFPGSQMSRLSIYFKEKQFITSKRSELYGLTDFLANCGGICGLFTGFSFLSSIELIYHFTIRLITNLITAH